MQNMFGTDGIRGPVGSGIFMQEKLSLLGSAIARWAIKMYGNHPRILITQDTRVSGAMIKAALKSGLLHYPVQLTDTFVLPTPAMAHFLKEGLYHCAIIISASHNPYHDNGIKIMRSDSSKLSSQDELTITAYMDYEKEHPRGPYGSDTPLYNAQTLYARLVASNFLPASLQGMTIVLDTAHGATSYVAPLIFRALGAHVIPLHNNPTGYNINDQCGSLYPALLQKTVVETGAHIGFAFDGDGDRVIAVNQEGIIKDGDDILALLASHPAYQQSSHIVGTVMSNEGLADFLAARGKKLIRTAVGDKYIREQLVEKKLLLGGEPSGHIIMEDLLCTGDGILVALRLLETIIAQQNWQMESFAKYPQACINIPVTVRKELKEEPLRTIITRAEASLTLGRVLVRYSGTESVLRIMVEADSDDTAVACCQELAHKLSDALTL